MAKISDQARQIAKKYVTEARKKIKVEKALLFGSAARGKMTEDSDIDMIIISDEFKEMDLIKRLVLLSCLRGRKFLDWPMDILGYTAEEFDKLSKISSMFIEAKRQGITIS